MMTMTVRLALLLLLAAPAAAAAAADPAEPRAKLEVASRPAGPWQAVPSGDEGQFLVKWTLVARETAGVAVSLDVLRLLAEDVAAAEKMDMPALDADGIRKLAARTSDLAAHGKLELPLRFYFAGPRRHIRVMVEIEGIDEAGNRVRATTLPIDIR